jgi:hypothetical protein
MNLLYTVPKKQAKLNYFLTYIILAFSGINFFLGDTYMLFGFIVVTGLFIYKKIRIDDYALVFIGLFVVLFILQSIFFHVVPFTTQIGMLMRILSGYFTIKIVGEDFPKFYINMIIVFSIISFVFYIPSIISYNFELFLLNHVAPIFDFYDQPVDIYKPFPQFIIYNINTDREHSIFPRNSGPFWEPGAFAGYLIVAIVLTIILEGNLFKNKKGILLSLAMISTLSTSGYLAFGIIIVSYFMLYQKSSNKILFFPLVIIVMYLSYTQLDFLGKKIEKDIKYSFSENPERLERTRFVGGMLDIQDLSKSPFIGNGLAPLDYSIAGMKKINHRTNGITNFANKFGIIMTFIYFFSMYLSFRSMCYLNNTKPAFAKYIMAAVFIVGFSELYFTQQVFFAFMFMNFTFFNYFHSPRILEKINFSLLRKNTA